MANRLYSILPGMVEEFYDEYLDGDRSEELFTEFNSLKELYLRIKEKLEQGKIPFDGSVDAKQFVDRMGEIIPIISPVAEKFSSLKVFW